MKKKDEYIIIDRLLIIGSYLFLAIPIMILLIFWFKWYVSTIAIILFTAAMILTLQNFKAKTSEEYKNIFNIKKAGILLVLIVVLNLISGAGGVSYQNWDYNGRNAILHDLIDNDWPVKYDYTNMQYESQRIGNNTGVLSYYFAYWLPGAIVGKLLGFKVASLFMLLWQTLGVTLFFYLLIRYMNKIKIKYFFIFIAFGGLDIITRYILNKMYGINDPTFGTVHIDTVNGAFCMSTFITQLFWVFNQAIPAWIVIMLLQNEKQYKKIGLYIALLLPYGPFPCMGLIIYSIIVSLFGFELNSFINLDRIKKLFSLQSILAVIAVVPIGLLFLQNSSEKGCVLIRAYYNGKLKETIFLYTLFIMFEFAIYSIITTKKNYKKMTVYFFMFSTLPIFYLGGGLDLGNRATIPILILLFVEIITFMDTNKSKIKKGIVMLILMLAFCTNFNEFYRSIRNTYENNKNGYSNFADNYTTFSSFKDKECDVFIKNFVAQNKENIFFEYIVK